MPKPAEMPFYEKPYVGQIFRRRENDQTYYEGQISGVKVFGTFIRDGVPTEDWTATIACGFSNEDRINAHIRPAAGSGTFSWLPVPAEEMEKRFGPGYTALKAENAALHQEIHSLTEKHEEVESRLLFMENGGEGSITLRDCEVGTVVQVSRIDDGKHRWKVEKVAPSDPTPPAEAPKPVGRQRTAPQPAG